MASLTFISVGFALALLVAAAPPLASVLIGINTLHTVQALLMLLIGALAALPVGRWMPVRSRFNVVAHLVGVALLCVVGPKALAIAGGVAVLVTLGFFSMRALQGLMRLHGSRQPGVEPSRLGALLGGLGVGLLLAPNLADHSLGLSGSMGGAAAMFLAACAFLVMTELPGAAVRPPASPTLHIGPALLLAVLIGGAAGPSLALLDRALGGTEVAAYLGPALLLLAACAGSLLARVLVGQASRLSTAGVLLLLTAAILSAAAALVPGEREILESTLAVASVPHDAPREHLAEPTALLGLGVAHLLALAVLLGALILGATIDRPPAGPPADRLLGCFALACVAASLSRIAPHDRRLAVCACGAAALFAVGLGIGRLARQRAWQTSTSLSAAALGVLIVASACLFGGWQRSDPSPAHAVHFEPDGSRFCLVKGADGSLRARIDGIPLPWYRPNQSALRRLVLLTIAQVESAADILVLGPGGGPIVDALLAVQPAPVTWATPVRGEARSYQGHDRLEVVFAEERAFVETRDGPFDIVFLTPPSPPIRRNGFLLTREFGQRLLERLTPQGVVSWILPLDSVEGRTLLADLVPYAAASLDDFVLLVDHPRNPRPAVALLASPTRFRMSPQRIARRLAEIATHSTDLQRAGLDLRGVLQTFLVDRDILRLDLRSPWQNLDDRPRLAMRLQSPPAAGDDLIEDSLRALAFARSSAFAVDRISFEGASEQEARAWTQEAARDFDATTQLLRGTRRIIAAGQTARDPGTDPGMLDLESKQIWQAIRRAPTLELVRRPVDAAIARQVESRQYDSAIEMTRQLYYMEGAPARLRLRVAQLEERAGRITGAEIGYREALERDPGHARSLFRLGCLLAGRGWQHREEAAVHLARALATESLTADERWKAKVVRLFASGRLTAARQELSRQPEGQSADPLLDYIRERSSR